ncbi:MAG: MoaD/ThiS family protein [Anaerolineales bacterium]|nr:MoaD/ThiS family protein [Anaerolineales bacterium]
MQTLRIPTPLRSYTDGRSEVNVSGRTIAEAMQDLTAHYPDLRPHLFNEEGNLRPFVNLFLNQEDIRSLQGLETPLKEDDRLMIIPSIAGG